MGSVISAWQQWMVKSAMTGNPALRTVTSLDLCKGQQRKMFSNMSFLMHCIEDKVRRSATASWIPKPTLEQANQMFNEVEEELLQEVGDTASGKKRRLCQLGWKTIANNLGHLRQNKRKK